MNFLSRTLIFAGILLLFFGGYLIFQRYNPKQLSFRNFNGYANSASGALPQKIIVPSLKIELPIYPAKISGNSWEATTKGVSYLVSSPVPGETGNSILYGHNWASLLGSLPKIVPGEAIEIVFGKGEKKTFIVEHTSIVAPSQTDILAPSSDTRLTLYTCTGFLDSKRFVATALLKSQSDLKPQFIVD